MEEFINTNMTDEEERRFLSSLKDDHSASPVLKNYVKYIQDQNTDSYKPLTKEEFGKMIKIKRNKRRSRFMIAASIMLVAIGSVIAWPMIKPSERSKSISQEEVDESLNTLYLALESFDTHYSKGIQTLNKGMNIPSPMREMSRIKLKHIEQ